MNKDIVSFKTAERLFELLFDEDTRYYYTPDGKLVTNESREFDYTTAIGAPRIYDAMLWMLQHYDTIIETKADDTMLDEGGTIEYYATVDDITHGYTADGVVGHTDRHEDYTSALAEGVDIAAKYLHDRYEKPQKEHQNEKTNL